MYTRCIAHLHLPEAPEHASFEHHFFSLIEMVEISWSNQCSRLKPSYEFHFEGLSNFSSSIEGLVQIQDVDLRI